MYVVQITQTNGDYTVARPQMTGNGENITTAIGDENNYVVSPAFMLASQLGNISALSWNESRDHCRQYVEYILYEGESEPRRLADWRMPTYAELQIIAQYQNSQPEIMSGVLTDEHYWAADTNTFLSTASWQQETANNNPQGKEVRIRCIRDVSPEDLAEFRAHNIR